MRNIISGKTLVQAVQEGGLDGAKWFPTRCTGHTLGTGLKVVADLLVSAKHRECNGGERVTQTREEYLVAQQIVERLELKGFTFEGTSTIKYQPLR